MARPSSLPKFEADDLSSKDGDGPDAGVGGISQLKSDAADGISTKTDHQSSLTSLLAGIPDSRSLVDPDLDGDEMLDNAHKDDDGFLHKRSVLKDENDDKDEPEEGEADVNGYDSYSGAREEGVVGDGAMEQLFSFPFSFL